MNTKTFEVVSEIKIRRPMWRLLGYGDQPSKKEVWSFYHKMLEEIASDAGIEEVLVVYMGSPGHYQVTTTFWANQPFWRRLGFGDTTSKQEVKWHFIDRLTGIAEIVDLSVRTA